MTDAPKNGAPPNGIVSPPQVEESLKPVIQDLPQPKQQEIVRTVEKTVEQTLIAAVRGTAGPQIDAETAKIITASLDKDNENRFKFLTQKQADNAKAEERKAALEVTRHSDTVKLLWPCLYAAILLVLGSTGAGIWFIAIGRDAIGSSILSGVGGLFFGFLGGLGSRGLFGKGS